MFLVSHFALSAGTCTWLRRERKGGLMRNTSGEMISGGGGSLRLVHGRIGHTLFIVFG